MKPLVGNRKFRVLRSLRRAKTPQTLKRLSKSLKLDERSIRWVFKNWPEDWPELDKVQVRDGHRWWAWAYFLSERYEKLTIPTTREDVRDAVLMGLEEIGPCGSYSVAEYIDEPTSTVRSDLQYFEKQGLVRKAKPNSRGETQWEIVK